MVWFTDVRRYWRCNRLHRSSRRIAVPTLGSILGCVDMSYFQQIARTRSVRVVQLFRQGNRSPLSNSRAGRLPRRAAVTAAYAREGRTHAVQRERPLEVPGARWDGHRWSGIGGTRTASHAVIEGVALRTQPTFSEPPHDHHPHSGDRAFRAGVEQATCSFTPCVARLALGDHRASEATAAPNACPSPVATTPPS